mmetsp:Transcript_22752/g.49089  ORF Transcript_22752/g.49089 Transcript_22752/m.49089 type:complete len:246 (+) Transcript_22752:129-866(+)
MRTSTHLTFARIGRPPRREAYRSTRMHRRERVALHLSLGHHDGARGLLLGARRQHVHAQPAHGRHVQQPNVYHRNSGHRPADATSAGQRNRLPLCRLAHPRHLGRGWRGLDPHCLCLLPARADDLPQPCLLRPSASARAKRGRGRRPPEAQQSRPQDATKGLALQDGARGTESAQPNRIVVAHPERWLKQRARKPSRERLLVVQQLQNREVFTWLSFLFLLSPHTEVARQREGRAANVSEPLCQT